VIISAIFRMKLVNFVHVCIPRTGMSHACGLVFGAGFGFQRQYIDLTNEQNDKWYKHDTILKKVRRSKPFECHSRHVSGAVPWKNWWKPSRQRCKANHRPWLWSLAGRPAVLRKQSLRQLTIVNTATVCYLSQYLTVRTNSAETESRTTQRLHTQSNLLNGRARQ